MMQELNYIRCGDYYIPDIRLPEENRPIGRWGRMHRDYIKEHNPIRFNDLCLSGELWTYLADLNEQAQNRLEIIIEQMKAAEGVTEDMKQHDQMAWVRAIHQRCFSLAHKHHGLLAKIPEGVLWFLHLKSNKQLDSNQFRQTQNPHAELREELCRFRKTGPK